MRGSGAHGKRDRLGSVAGSDRHEGPGSVRVTEVTETPVRPTAPIPPPETKERVMSSAEASTETPRIVVGVDGSQSSKAALAWAARQATLTRLPLAVVAAWEIPTYGWSIPQPDALDLHADAEAMLAAAIDEVLGADPGVELSTLAIEGHPALVLTEESKSASLIVVGSRGHGEFVGMLLGSVSEFLTAHAHCPVVVIRDGEGAKPAG